MARPREFDIDDAVTRAMAVFWEHGYDATTTDQLLGGMRLTRGSLYKAFGDKKALFLRALHLYDAQEVEKAVAVLTQPDLDGIERINLLFGSITAAVQSGDRMGCLLCSTLSGFSVNDPEISAMALASAAKLHDGFDRALKDSREAKFPTSYARLLVTQYVGLRVLSRTGVSAGVICESVEAVEALLRR
ncbi:TetR/AcrR family transcriptional regulator [Alphaproteobacteria bacterium KMM 3653]|uniref:TetR/AcrR family transcriptional regulator n=1 Tax=Harenicola maris TaxID=2841044 RepID=A0AAP2G771_9RHOB|nr:TetR/AcrR family transcriptional regulator [Harenicola maris]